MRSGALRKTEGSYNRHLHDIVDTGKPPAGK